jgi:uncharacterized protein
MNDPQSYASMDCPTLSHERDAVEANRASHEEAGTGGFWNVFGAIVEGLAAGSGNASLASQQHTANAQVAQMQSDHAATADAYQKRIDLLDKVSAVRKCS